MLYLWRYISDILYSCERASITVLCFAAPTSEVESKDCAATKTSTEVTADATVDSTPKPAAEKEAVSTSPAPAAQTPAAAPTTKDGKKAAKVYTLLWRYAV